MTTIWAIDPGPHTGIFYMLPDGKPNWVTLDYTTDVVQDPHRNLYLWLMQMVDPDKDTVVCETFEFRKEDAKNREYIDYSPGEFVGAIKVYCQMTGCKHKMQTASQAKGFWTDDKLRRVGLYALGKHNRDATRHWLHYVSFTLKDDSWFHKLKQ
jgi:hypothetical protein